MRAYSLPCLPMSSPGAPKQAFRDVEPIVGGRRGLACGIREPLSKLFDLVSEREVFPLEPELFVLQLIDARPQPREFARAGSADALPVCLGALFRALGRPLGRSFPGRLPAPLGVGPGR